MRLKGEPTVIERRSVVNASADRVWLREVTSEGINDEMNPWMTMSLPRSAESLTVDDVPGGTPIGRAWLAIAGYGVTSPRVDG